MKKILIIFLLFSMGLSAQRRTDDRVIEDEWRYIYGRKFNKWSLAAGYGIFWMSADVNDYNMFPNNIKFTPSAILSWQLHPALAFDLKYLYGDMYGKATYNLYNEERIKKPVGVYFKGDLHDISLNASFFINQIIPFPGPVKDRWNFFVKVGAGTSYFRSALYYTENDEFVGGYAVDSPTEGYLVNGWDKYNPTEKTARRQEVVVPATAGVMYRINNFFDISLEANWHFTLSDHYDNLLYGASNDAYPYVGIYLHYIFGKKDRRHLRWTYRGYGFDLFGRPKVDPLVDEVDLFEKDIAKFVDNREPKIYVVELTNTEYSVFQPVFIRTIFFPQGGNIRFSTEDIILMAETAVQMRANPEATMTIYSHVDDSDPGDHTKLTDDQCEKVIDFLVEELAVDRTRIKTQSLGSSKPLVTGAEAAPEVRKMGNRRVDMVLTL